MLLWSIRTSVHTAIAATDSWRNVSDVTLYRPSGPQEVLMSIMNLLIIGALIATVVVLALGPISMARGGTYNKKHAENSCGSG